MSTFNGIVDEFPDIRIDHFRLDPDSRPALAYFLSHVHSDHLVGLESCKSPFIYCTPATRDILLRLEKYPHRVNFARGILESRKQTYQHLKKLLKAIPLETPTTIELAPGSEIRVTLFDANHCVGGCLFLIEGVGKAILYTGDIRSEVWWVNALTRHPILLPYACPPHGEPLRTLDCIYLDTTFVASGKEDQLRHFPPKAEGIDELLRKVARYPADTLFYFDSWTFGYEDVWQALSTFLNSPVHLDDYRYGLYRALTNGVDPKAPEGVKMIGFHCGNHYRHGCLTEEQSLLHSCEKGTGCEIWSKDFVRITPIISRHDGVEMAEIGAGGGQSDLNQRHELETSDQQQIGELISLCTKKLTDQPRLLTGVLELLTSVIRDGVHSLPLEDFIPAYNRVPQPNESGFLDLDGMALDDIIPTLTKLVTKANLKKSQTGANKHGRSGSLSAPRADGLPKQITFPYSRHSSYHELCLLVEAFRPRQIFPCTVDEKRWNVDCSMDTLFGHLYESAPTFRHDQEMFKKRGQRGKLQDVGSRPHSSDSMSTEYATPSESQPKTQVRLERPQTNHKRISDDSLGRDSAEEAAKRRKMDHQPQGDYWPPVEVDHYARARVDHYSPTGDRYSRYEADPPTGNTVGDPIDLTSWSGITQVEHSTPTSPIRNRWQKLIAQSREPKPIENAFFGPKQRSHRQSLGSGRLSPPPHPASGTLFDAKMEKQRAPRQSLEYGRLSPPPTENRAMSNNDYTLHSSANAYAPSSRPLRRSSAARSNNGPVLSPNSTKRLAFRKEAQNAVLGVDGSNWNDVGLVSVSGHQIKEEEL